MVRIPIQRKGKPRPMLFALIDEADVPRVAHHCWFLDGDGYVKRNEGRRGERLRKIYLHREIMGLGEAGPANADQPVVDHINRDKLDNRRGNLRIITRAQNCQNRLRRGGTSRHRGVALIASTGRWQAYGGVDGTLAYLGTFASEDEAARVARAWRRENLPYSVD